MNILYPTATCAVCGAPATLHLFGLKGHLVRSYCPAHGHHFEFQSIPAANTKEYTIPDSYSQVESLQRALQEANAQLAAERTALDDQKEKNFHLENVIARAESRAEAAEAQRDAMDRRADAAESDWQAAEKQLARLNDDPALIEAIAAWDHDEAWSGWTRYLLEGIDKTHRSGEPNRDRWKRQTETKYVDLSEAEKESDRAEARRVLAVIRAALAPALRSTEEVKNEPT